VTVYTSLLEQGEAIAGFDDRPDASAESGNVVVNETEFSVADDWAEIRDETAEIKVKL